jgi:mycothiol synthase
MNFSAITVSYPIDEETFNEISQLCENAEQVDLVSYRLVMNLALSRNADVKGFFVLIYDDVQNVLAGAASAVDLMGLNTYEWSILVDPMYRNIGLGEALYNVLRNSLEMRGSEGDLALAVESSNYGEAFLMDKNYRYSFSEATLEAKAEVAQQPITLHVRPYTSQDSEALCEIFSKAFGDTKEESLDLIDFNSATEGLHLWVAELENEIVATVTTRKEGNSHWVSAFAVHPNQQNKGIGSQVLIWVKDYVLRAGESNVLLDVELENKKALSIYEKNGFLISTKINYYVQTF